MLLWILAVALWCIAVAVDENAIDEASAELLTNSTNTNATLGPTKELIRKIARRMELVHARRGRGGKRRGKGHRFDEKSFRAAVGPRDTNHTIPPEADKRIRAVAFEGDMILNPEQIEELLATRTNEESEESGSESDNSTERRKRQAQTDQQAMWSPNEPIAYYIDSSLSSYTSLINQAIQYWTEHSCLTFTLNANGKNRLRIYKGSGCWSYVGKQYAWTSQDVSIGNGCQYRQLRHVNLANVEQSQQYNFDKHTYQTANHYGLPYDYGSVMQYDPYSFAINYNIPTITAKDINYQNIMGQRESPSFYDVRQLNLLYNCASRCSYKPSCQNNGIVNSKTCSTCLCPRGFSGNYCESVQKGTGSACNGRIVQASSTSLSTFTASVGNGNDYQYRSTPYECYWQIKAPAGRRIQFQLQKMDTYCREGCDWAGFEVNTGNLDRSGML
ncbi:unnamed protein product [Cylicocyclus nassatus]|uniref:Metalloendopeptidase n=1 Tax=Cylicocyclus nassatus TaxID=53992 RepID=A0AA36MDY1_CYLNA|nr:unnamed protein product [Cylicocyclus nassatus]